jgi:hypothetical protein
MSEAVIPGGESNFRASAAFILSINQLRKSRAIRLEQRQ